MPKNYLPHSAVYRTLTMMSLGSWIVGIGRVWTETCFGPSNTTQRIWDMMGEGVVTFY